MTSTDQGKTASLHREEARNTWLCTKCTQIHACDHACNQSSRTFVTLCTWFRSILLVFSTFHMLNQGPFGRQFHLRETGAAQIVDMPKLTIARSYLAAYNTAQAAGWAFALYQCVSTFWSADGYATVYENTNAVVSRYIHHLMSVKVLSLC